MHDRATHVPVGEDQTQHLELCRNLAELFNRKYPDRLDPQSKEPMFPLPQTIYSLSIRALLIVVSRYTHFSGVARSSRILSLRDPTQKMSKSAPDPNSRIMLTDSPASITKKIRSAVTDSTHGITYDPAGRPGISNLVEILAAFRSFSSDSNVSLLHSVEDAKTVAAEYAGRGAGDLKKDVAEAVLEAWRHPREELERLRADRSFLEHVFEEGNQRARALASVTLASVKERIGLAKVITAI